MPDLRLTNPNTESTSAGATRGRYRDCLPTTIQHHHDHSSTTMTTNMRTIMITKKAGSNGRE